MTTSKFEAIKRLNKVFLNIKCWHFFFQVGATPLLIEGRRTGALCFEYYLLFVNFRTRGGQLNSVFNKESKLIRGEKETKQKDVAFLKAGKILGAGCRGRGRENL